MKYIIHTDGGSRGNPGPAATGYIIANEVEEIAEGKEYIGETTNNQAEYQGLHQALTKLFELVENGSIDYPSEVHCFLDSKLVVEQVKGTWKMKNAELKPWLEKIRKIMNQHSQVRFVLQHIPRAQNAEADALVNQCLDARMI